MKGFSEVLKSVDNLKRDNDLSNEEVVDVLLRIKKYYQERKD